MTEDQVNNHLMEIYGALLDDKLLNGTTSMNVGTNSKLIYVDRDDPIVLEYD